VDQDDDEEDVDVDADDDADNDDGDDVVEDGLLLMLLAVTCCSWSLLSTQCSLMAST
jgi:hypothetical protein